MRPNIVDWTSIATSTANTAITTQSIAAVTGQRHCLSGLSVVVSGAAVGTGGAAINIKTGTTEIYRLGVPAGTAIGGVVSYQFESAIPTKPGEKLDIVTAAGGTSCVLTVSAAGFTRAD